jgi:LexA-binding, inner membrane-associated putative hydrolase
MRPYGHLAGGVLLGALLARGEDRLHPALTVAFTSLAANVPDLDIAYPIIADHYGIDHDIDSPKHHSWVTHTPVFWLAVLTAATQISKHPKMPLRIRALVRLLRWAVALHLAQDATANSVSLAYPLKKKEYGLRLDGIGTEDHADYLEMYKGTKAWYVEQVLAILAAVAIYHLWRSHKQNADAHTDKEDTPQRD